jgi:hypothetical protein
MQSRPHAPTLQVYLAKVSIPHTCTASLQSKGFNIANLHCKNGAKSSILGVKLFRLDAKHKDILSNEF